ncbi:MAG: M20 family metallopeptidase [candidate division NC10 bacterium]|nr:M20 family metallopeptidase [candidate division NC10 bacterium]
MQIEVDRQHLIHLLSDLVAIESINLSMKGAKNGEAAIGNYVFDYMKDLGMEVKKEEALPGRFNILGRLPGTNSRRRLLFEAHLDTMPVEGMEIDPFQARIEEGRLYGRGACDDKASVAAMLYALKIAKEQGRPKSDLYFLGSVDEEYTFKGILHFLQGGFWAQGAVVGEPTELDLVIAHKGMVRWRIVVTGKAAHSSKPKEGINAIVKMAKIIHQIEEKIQPRLSLMSHPLVGPATLSIGKIEGGIQINIVPDRCVIELDRRLIPGEDANSALSSFDQLLMEMKSQDPELQVAMESPFLVDYPLETEEKEEVVDVARKAITEVLGQVQVKGVPYGTDGSKIARAGIPTIVLGPGSIDQAHTAREYVEVEQLIQAARIYARMMLAF